MRVFWRFFRLMFLTIAICLLGLPSSAQFLPSQFGLEHRPAAEVTNLTAEAWEQRAQADYTIGHYLEAATGFEQAAHAYQATNHPLKQAITLANLSLCYQHLGQWPQAEQVIAESLQVLTSSDQIPLSASAYRWARAQVLDIQGTLQLSLSQPQAALIAWEAAADLYEQINAVDRARQSLLNQVQALQALGLYRRAQTTLIDWLGFSPSTLASWEALSPALQQLPRSPDTLTALQSLGEVLRVLGNLTAAQEVLNSSLTQATALQLPAAMATAHLGLGNVMHTQALRDLKQNNLTLTDAVDLTGDSEGRDRNRPDLSTRSPKTLAAHRFYRTLTAAFDHYEQAATLTTSPTTQIQARLNQVRLLVERQSTASLPSLWISLQSQIAALPLSPSTLEAQLNLAQSLLLWLSQPGLENPAITRQSQPMPTTQQIETLLKATLQQAKDFQDWRSIVYAQGLLGNLYEQMQQLPIAAQFTQQALQVAQQHQANDLLYPWQWQLGRILTQQAERSAIANVADLSVAIDTYTEAVKTLQAVRSDLVAVTSEAQFSFRDTIEPIYRELVALLVKSQTLSPDPKNLQQIRAVIESLQLAELDDFFREACLHAVPTAIDTADAKAAVLYPILLSDQIVVIVSLPQLATQTSSQSSPVRLDYFTVPVAKSEVESTVSRLQDALTRPSLKPFLAPSQTLYDWLIRPIATELAANQVETLVFVLDGGLRNIPMAVLHDGQEYLVEKPYSIALTPGLQLLGDRPLAQVPLTTGLLAGVTEARPGFGPLPGVKVELQQIQGALAQLAEGRVTTTTLLDNESSRNELSSNGETFKINGAFTRQNFQAALREHPFPIVHLATHGRFSSQLDDTYILTADGQLSIEDLQTILQTANLAPGSPLELLVLSACETAVGDNRATLGLAGVAIRAGARSTIATLWKVDDQASALFMGEFYRQLGMVTAPQSRASLLQQAQQTLLQNPNYSHPYFWAPYILIGNWQ